MCKLSQHHLFAEFCRDAFVFLASNFCAGASWEEENWRAQYGQVTEPNEELDLDIQTVDLWDWEMIRGRKKNGKRQVARLVGRLVKSLSKLHPSVPSGAIRLKTAPIRAVHLDLVQVTSGLLSD